MDRADLTNANLTGTDVANGLFMRDAKLSGATWPNGRVCAQGSIGDCLK